MGNSRISSPGRSRSRLWKWSLEVLRKLIPIAKSCGARTPACRVDTRVDAWGFGFRCTLALCLAATAFAAETPVTFLRDVAPILNKVGCTSGLCHGAAKGKNGFKLSLRGYDPRFDYEALLYDLSGRRFNRADPGSSLMLAKPTQQVAHT